MTKQELADWCGNMNNSYEYSLDGVEYNTGFCPFVCEEIAEDILNGHNLRDITDQAESIGHQLAWEVSHNNTRLYEIITRRRQKLIISYYDINR